mmetsp:Transcript_110884/g.254121  ORF Transcript_110884/g.254121 Transcript_110884/m.254121 type:complete len:136 (-) Transcript_110884:87-494(-)
MLQKFLVCMVCLAAATVCDCKDSIPSRLLLASLRAKRGVAVREANWACPGNGCNCHCDADDEGLPQATWPPMPPLTTLPPDPTLPPPPPPPPLPPAIPPLPSMPNIRKRDLPTLPPAPTGEPGVPPMPPIEEESL